MPLCKLHRLEICELVSNQMVIQNKMEFFIGSLDWYSSGDQFLRGVAVLAFAGATWATALVLDVFNLLCNGRGVCEKKCG